MTTPPLNPETGEPFAPKDQPGYYAGFSTLSQSPYWDAATRGTIQTRVDHPPERRFFNAFEWKFWETVFEHLIPQTDRTPERQIPLVPPLDARLHANHTAGYRYESMPQDREAYKLGMEAINQESLTRFGGEFLHLGHLQQETVLQAIHDGRPEGAREIWKAMSVGRFWQLIMGDAMEAYYSHPWAWDEIGFGGPAYPRAYIRLENGEPEPWEVREKRYQWAAPDFTLSDEVEPIHHLHTEALQRAHISSLRKKP